MSTVPSIDYRIVENTRLEGESLRKRDLMLLCLLRLNDRESINSLTCMQKLVYIAQVGGLHDHRRETIEYDSISSFFTFKKRTYGPYSEDLTETLETLVEYELVDSVEHPSSSGNGRIEYSLTDFGNEILDEKQDALTTSDIRTLKAVKVIYAEVPTLELIDIVEHDFKFRKLNDML